MTTDLKAALAKTMIMLIIGFTVIIVIAISEG